MPIIRGASFALDVREDERLDASARALAVTRDRDRARAPREREHAVLCAAKDARDGDLEFRFRANARGPYVAGVSAFGERCACEVVERREGSVEGESETSGERVQTLICASEFDIPVEAIGRGRGRKWFAAREDVEACALALSHCARDGERGASGASDDAKASVGFCGVYGCRAHVGDRKATLSAVLDGLRPEMKTTLVPISSAESSSASAGDLPEEVVMRILGFLDAKGASALAATCRGLRARVDELSPDLALTLHPHQRAALRWMRRRERRAPRVSDPAWKRLQCKENGEFLWFNASRLEFSAEAPETFEDSPGGMLCDEPGLGKTVTVLALVLARRGWRPAPPPGLTARQQGSGWYYEDIAALDAYVTSMGVEVNAREGGDASTSAASTPAKSSADDARAQDSRTTPGRNSSGLRRSKRSSGGTPVGYFAAVNKDGMYGTTTVSSAKRSRLEAKRAYDALAAATNENPNPDWHARLECSAFAAPIGYIARDGLREDSSRLRRNTSYFESVLHYCFVNIGRATTIDVVDYILENIPEVSHSKPLSMPPFRRNDDQPAVFRALGLERAPESARLENSIPYVPPGPASNDLLLDRQALFDAIRVVDNRSESAPKRVWLSSATLIVVPSVLIAHWLQQISICTRNVARERALRVAVVDKRQTRGTPGDESPYAVVDDLTAIDAKDLASDYDVVIMTFDRLSTEFTQIDTPLLRVLWQRVVLDEGHQLSKTLSITNRLSVACALKAHSRWLMTGTPTPTTLKGAGTAHLQPLLAFLRHPPYGASATLWTNAIQRPLEGSDRMAQAEAVERLGEVLRRCMVRTCKSHIALRPMKRTIVMLSFNDVHAESYDGLVAHVKRGLLLADWGDPNHVQSLLNTKRVREASLAVNNLREAACVVGKMPVVFDPKEFDETVRDLRDMLKKRGFTETDREERIKRVCPTLVQCKGACDLCKHEVIYPLVTPCAHVLCCACVLHDGCTGTTVASSDAAPALPEGVSRAPRGCPVCGIAYSMQEAKPNEYNESPLQEVPQDLIELQPSYDQLAWTVSDDGDRVTAQGVSTKVDHLLMFLRKIGAAVDAETLREQNERDEISARNRLAMSERVPGWGGEINANALAPQASNRRRRLIAATPIKPRDLTPGLLPPKKCIIYSNFATHIHVIDLALTDARVPFETLSRLGSTRHDKDQALDRFRRDPDVCALLLDQKAAEGLDLSFVSHVILMEPLSNASLEEQVVSRAHRMGQTGEVHVQVLAMRGTAEETLLDVQQELRGRKSSASEEGDVGVEADVAPTVAMEALSRRRILERLSLASSKAADDAVMKRERAVREHFDRLESDDRGAPQEAGRILGRGYKKFELEEARDIRDAVEASALDVALPARQRSSLESTTQDAPWNLRVRDPNNDGTIANFTLPNCGRTTASALQARIAQRLALPSLDAYTVSCGFPPRALEDKDLATAIALLGVRDNDLITLRGASVAEAPEPRVAAPTLTTRQSGAYGVNGAAMASMTLKNGETDVEIPENDKRRYVESEKLDAAVRRRLSAQLQAAETSTAIMLQDPDDEGAGVTGANTAMSIDLLRAAEGMSKKKLANDPTVRSLQDAFKAIVDERAKEAEGNAKVAAARAGAVTYATLADGRIVVKYSASDVAGGRLTRTERSDCVQDIPKAMLPYILATVGASKDGGISRANLSPPAMAVASPRMFWSIVRHGGVGPTVSFAQALQRLAPDVCDWSALSRRERAANPKYADYDTTDGAIDEFG